MNSDRADRPDQQPSAMTAASAAGRDTVSAG
jgi:hypothetical protein